jgi:hypothetical protein
MARLFGDDMKIPGKMSGVGGMSRAWCIVDTSNGNAHGVA